MTQQERQKSRIPEFKNRQEAAERFDTHEVPGDYLDEFEVVEAQVDLTETLKSLNVRLAPEVFTKLQVQADEKGIGTSTLVRDVDPGAPATRKPDGH